VASSAQSTGSKPATLCGGWLSVGTSYPHHALPSTQVATLICSYCVVARLHLFVTCTCAHYVSGRMQISTCLLEWQPLTP